MQMLEIVQPSDCSWRSLRLADDVHHALHEDEYGIPCRAPFRTRKSSAAIPPDLPDLTSTPSRVVMGLRSAKVRITGRLSHPAADTEYMAPDARPAKHHSGKLRCSEHLRSRKRPHRLMDEFRLRNQLRNETTSWSL